MSNAVLNTFTNYQKSRIQFVQSLAELAKRKENHEAIMSAGAIMLLRPLITDVIPSVSQTACIALGRLTAESQEAAETVVSMDVLPHIIYSIAEQNRLFKKCASFVLRSLAKHTPELAQSIVAHDGLPALSKTLDEYDISVKEAGCWAISYIAKHSETLATAVVDTITIEKIVDCVREPELPLKRIAVNCLTQIAKHNDELAKMVASKDRNLLSSLMPLVTCDDVLLRRQTLACLSQIANNKRELAELVRDAVPIDAILKGLKVDDLIVRVNAVELLKNLVKHSVETARAASAAHAEQALADYLRQGPDEVRECAIETLKTMASFESPLAVNMLNLGIDTIVLEILKTTSDESLKSLCIKFLGSVSQYSSDHSKGLNTRNILQYLLSVVSKGNGKADLDEEFLKSISSVLRNYKDVEGMERLLQDRMVPVPVLAIVCRRLATLLQNDPVSKKQFAKLKGLQAVWNLKKRFTGVDPSITTALDDICGCYPDELVRLYNPDYPAVLIKKINEFGALA